MSEFQPKTVAQFLAEMAEYPADAQVKSFKVVVDNGRMKSTVTYSDTFAKKLAKMRAARQDQPA